MRLSKLRGGDMLQAVWRVGRGAPLCARTESVGAGLESRPYGSGDSILVLGTKCDKYASLTYPVTPPPRFSKPALVMLSVTNASSLCSAIDVSAASFGGSGLSCVAMQRIPLSLSAP